jgi:hypothetical protein
MAITVRFLGISEARGLFEQLPKRLERQTILRMSQIAYDEAQAGAGRHHKTGALFRSLYNRQIPNGREVGHDPDAAPHALFVNFGTRPHVIRPKEKKALRWSAGGKFIFAKAVNHPGYAGDPYMVRAADESIRQFTTIIDEEFRRL